uniref:Uncharacterized protein n=1 Tax=Caenorhabditis japonica TaxID=281687 RepID=A0A8R1ECI5_CAEJA
MLPLSEELKLGSEQKAIAALRTLGLRAERSLLLEKYKAKVENRTVDRCIKFLKCYPAKPLPISKLWKDPVTAATPLGLAVKPFVPGGDADP